LNFYGLPEFISYSILVGIAVVLIRQNQAAQLFKVLPVRWWWKRA